MTNYRNLVVVAHPEEELINIVRSMGLSRKPFFGLCVIVDEEEHLLGVINDGDILRLMARNANINRKVKEFMVTSPIRALDKLSNVEIVNSVKAQMIERTNGEKDLTRYIPLVDESGKLKRIVDVFEIIGESRGSLDSVEVYGLGFVGLTLGVALAGLGHKVCGIDRNEGIIKDLLCGKVHVHEPMLNELLSRCLKEERLVLGRNPLTTHSRVKIIAVGTPVRNSGEVDLEALRSVCKTISGRLNKGDLVMLRSTVPVGTTRSLVKGILEASGLEAGIDFSLAFTPERTVEGAAMQELASLPQIISGLSEKCVKDASEFWQGLTSSVVRVESLEAGELVKLVNNSFRDVSFAFANGLGLYADKYNLDAFSLIEAANEGYPRNRIPSPSPGVGGYCLTKDPYLYGSEDVNLLHSKLAIAGRRVNEEIAKYPVKQLERFSKRCGKHISEMKVVIAGVAFKGIPETNDVRGSSTLEVIGLLRSLGVDPVLFDAVVPNERLAELGRITEEITGSVMSDCDAYIIMNNHPDNVPEGLLEMMQASRCLLFDGWKMVDRRQIAMYKSITYSTIGYLQDER